MPAADLSDHEDTPTVGRVPGDDVRVEVTGPRTRTGSATDGRPLYDGRPLSGERDPGAATSVGSPSTGAGRYADEETAPVRSEAQLSATERVRAEQAGGGQRELARTQSQVAARPPVIPAALPSAGMAPSGRQGSRGLPQDGLGIPAAARITRGVVRLLTSLDYRSLSEFPLPDGRRADVCALGPRGIFAIVEVKSSPADFRADGKWPHYREYCDLFYFAIDPGFPASLLPDDAGLIVADAWTGTVVRPAAPSSLGAARRRALMLRFARTAAGRLDLLTDPGPTEDGRDR